MVNIVLRWLWSITLGVLISPFWFLIGYFLIAIYVTREAGFWFFNKLSFVFSLENYEEIPLEFPKAISSIIWFYLFGWLLGPFMFILAWFFAISIIGYKTGAKMIWGIHAVVIPSPTGRLF
jgi:hypothetical protein